MGKNFTYAGTLSVTSEDNVMYALPEIPHFVGLEIWFNYDSKEMFFPNELYPLTSYLGILWRTINTYETEGFYDESGTFKLLEIRENVTYYPPKLSYLTGFLDDELNYRVYLVFEQDGKTWYVEEFGQIEPKHEEYPLLETMFRILKHPRPEGRGGFKYNV